MSAMASPLALFLAVVLLTAAAHKLAARDRLATAAARLAGVAPALGQPLSLAAAAVEAGAGLALAVPAARPAGAIVAALLWTAYAVLLWRAHRAGRAFDCGCSFGAQPKIVTLYPVRRAAVLALLAIVAALLPAAMPGALDLFAALAFFALYLAAGELAAVSSTGRSLAR
ncbi:hypothetical protein GG804_20390 [Sphingomonas histidinilytica]|nr:hypothetical protein [Rhizorhabdus histidinilytica]